MGLVGDPIIPAEPASVSVCRGTKTNPPKRTAQTRGRMEKKEGVMGGCERDRRIGLGRAGGIQQMMDGGKTEDHLLIPSACTLT
jgi:hypothetical protein